MDKDEYVNFLQVGDGDSIRIRWYDETENVYRNIFFDLGSEGYYDSVRDEIISFEENEKIDLLIISHIDNDHIHGAISLINDKSMNLKELVSRWWFNYGDNLKIPIGMSPNLAKKEGKSLSEYLDEGNHVRNKTPAMAVNSIDFFGAVITILSPNSEGVTLLDEKTSPNLAPEKKKLERDYKKDIKELAALPNVVYSPSAHEERPYNHSSISILFESKQGVKYLLLADSSPKVIIESIELLKEHGSKYINEEGKLEVDYMQISHHGSKYNTNYKLLKLISCKHFIISTDGSMHRLPNKTTLSRIIDPHQKYNRDISKLITFYFNHNNQTLNRIFPTELDDKLYNEEFNFKCCYTVNKFPL